MILHRSSAGEPDSEKEGAAVSNGFQVPVLQEEGVLEMVVTGSQQCDCT